MSENNLWDEAFDLPKYREAKQNTQYQSAYAPQIVTYPYPPMVQMPDGTWYETPDIVTLVKLVYDLRNRVHELENGGKK